MKAGQPAVYTAEPRAKPGEPKVMNGDPKVMNGDPKLRAAEPKAKAAELMANAVECSMEYFTHAINYAKLDSCKAKYGIELQKKQNSSKQYIYKFNVQPLNCTFMNERVVATEQSFKGVSGVLKRKADDFSAFTSVAEDVIILDGLITDIDTQTDILDISTKGYTETKNAAKIYAVTIALRPVSTRIMAYACKNRLDVLKNEINFTEKALLKKADKRLVNILRVFLKNARIYLPDMSSLGLTEDMINALEAAIADFEAKLLGTPQYLGEQKAAKQRIAKDIADGEILLKNDIDPITEIIRDDKPATYAEYQNARKIKLPPRRKLALKIKVFESGSLQLLSGVTLTITPDTNGDLMKAGADLQKTVKRTSPFGASQVKNLSDGKYLITAEKPGLEPKTATAYISSGQTCIVIIEMTALQ